ncbi:hypothetical protein OF897_15710 [Chryseobacterium formosus]|uniref:HTH luxR-type domain-containing protein n=1 Tax=Chryseobacterium formosus TaxID=1537363 RepID=A0ABT3XUL5_9FLAO|nr:hypothetical protein [Chryseobacterium formosus]MCX8525365.1 hypothetical protein [Chryseobacterium formosus]
MKKKVLINFLQVAVVFGGLYFYLKNKQKKSTDNSQQKDAEKPEILHIINDDLEEVFQLAKINDPFFLAKFKKIYPEFCNKIISLYPDILNSELIFCAYIKLNFSTKEIANYTFVTKKAVQVRKSRLRKKFNIPSGEDLYIWFKKL